MAVKNTPTFTRHNVPIIAISGFSGSGKTTLLEQIIAMLVAQNLNIAVIKHSHHHKLDFDRKGKDSYRFKQAGAVNVVVGFDGGFVQQASHDKSYELSYLLEQIDQTGLDLILVEGFKDEKINKILVHRKAMESIENPKFLPEIDEFVCALALDYTFPKNDENRWQLPVLDLNDVKNITKFITNRYKIVKKTNKII